MEDEKNSNVEALQSMIETKIAWRRRLDNLNSVIALAIKALSDEEMEAYIEWAKKKFSGESGIQVFIKKPDNKES
jgi:hypothetical protein